MIEVRMQEIAEGCSAANQRLQAILERVAGAPSAAENKDQGVPHMPIGLSIEQGLSSVRALHERLSQLADLLFSDAEKCAQVPSPHKPSPEIRGGRFA